MIKIGLLLIINDDWLGGVNYYRNLVKAVYNIPNRNIEFIIFTDKRSNSQYLQDFKHLRIIRSSLFDKFSFAWVLRKICILALKKDLLFSYLLKKNGVQVLSHSGWLGKNSEIPSIGWIQDFQHLHLQDFFTRKERKFRDKLFSDICNYCTRVIVSSEDALKDLKQFSPEIKSKAVVLKFAVRPVSAASNLISIEELERKYNFEKPFFLLPNQFWAHKNHKVVIEALGLLKKNNIKITVLATGNTHDPRQPGFYSSLQKNIESNNVKMEFKVLGLIPKSHLDLLFINANAIINPSLFEGWSTSVEEAKMFGKKLLLSDIPIHREQNPDRAAYFMPDDAVHLSWLLESHLKINNLYEPNIGQAENMFLNFGINYQNIVNHVVHEV